MVARIPGCTGKVERDAGVLTTMSSCSAPWADTSMLARRLTTILPAMTLAEAIETTRIHRVAGLTGNRTALITTHPCHSSHQTMSDADLIGGGYVPRPGEVLLAHYGVLFMDEWPEMRRHIIMVCNCSGGGALR
jgi:magnesium chelatase family protein